MNWTIAANLNAETHEYDEEWWPYWLTRIDIHYQTDLLQITNSSLSEIIQQSIKSGRSLDMPPLDMHPHDKHPPGMQSTPPVPKHLPEKASIENNGVKDLLLDENMDLGRYCNDCFFLQMSHAWFNWSFLWNWFTFN